MRFLFLLVLWFTLGSSLGFAEKLAVLEFNGVGVDKAYLELLTDSARSGALRGGSRRGDRDLHTREHADDALRHGQERRVHGRLL